MRGRIGFVFGLVAFWLIAANTVLWARAKFHLLYVEPRNMQQYFLGIILEPRTLRSQFSSYNYDGSGLDMWVYELSVEEANRLRRHCVTSSFIKFDDPQNEVKNEPLPACTFGSRGEPIDGQRYEDARVSGVFVALMRQSN